MSDASWDDFLDELKSKNTPMCGVQVFLNTLDESASRLVEAAFKNPDVSRRSLHKALVKRGFDRSTDIVGRHKSKDCACFRKASK